MTLTSLFGAGPSAREPPSMGDNLENYYGIDRGGHGWKSKSEMKKTKSTLSALTLLAFLFFLNLLLTCLKDTLQGNDPEIIVVPQQRVTRRVSGQLVGIVGPMGDTGESPPPPILSPVMSPTLGDEHAGATLSDDSGHQRTKKTRRSLPADDDDDDGETTVETVHEEGGGRAEQDEEDRDDELWPADARRPKKLPDADYETSLETPETLRDDGDKVSDYDYGTLGPLDYTGVEPESLGWEAVDDVREDRASDTSDSGEDVGREDDRHRNNTEADDGSVPSEVGVGDEGGGPTKPAPPGDKQVATVPANPVWEAMRAVLEVLGRQVAGKGWQESLASMQHPGMGLFHVGEQVLNYAMPILRETSTKFGFDPAMCKELVVCETSRLAWMWGDKDVTSAFNGVFEWLYGMEEPELRSINREWKKKKKKSCRNYINRCKSEAGEGSWLPMIANVLEYFVT